MVTSSRGSDLWNHLGVQAKREIDWWTSKQYLVMLLTKMIRDPNLCVVSLNPFLLYFLEWRTY